MGEFFSLNLERCRRVIDIAASFPKGAAAVYAGASRMDPAESAALANYAYDRGLDGAMIVSPSYFPLTPEETYDFYAAIAAKTPINIILYNYPARTGYSITSETILKLVDKFPHVRGVKDTILDVGHTAELIAKVKPKFPYFKIFSGYDNNFAHNVISGGDGCVGGLANVFPEFFSEWIQALKDENFARTARCQRIVDQMMELYALGDPAIPTIKMAAKLRGFVDSDICAPPFREANAARTRRIAALFAKLGLRAGRDMGKSPDLDPIPEETRT
jgi:4-hydroxy-tetrahydrodipicolinate synthase